MLGASSLSHFLLRCRHSCYHPVLDTLATGALDEHRPFGTLEISTMLRLRRYRVFIVLAIIAVGLLYHFRGLGGLDNASSPSIEGLKNFGGLNSESDSTTAGKPSSDGIKPDDVLNEKQPSKGRKDPMLWAASKTLAATPSAPASTGTIQSTSAPGAVSTETPDPKSTASSNDKESDTATATKNEASHTSKTVAATSSEESASGDEGDQGTGEEEENQEEDTVSKIHWKKQKEHFPVPSDSIIQLPTGKPKAIPKIQHNFPDESATEKVDREKKLGIIKTTFEYSWAGYKKNAWMHDQLSPVSGSFTDPFGGWGATLVDSLDTLWMMGLKSEFEEATKAVADIDFTTSIRNDIPVFETVIRYLGGLIAAYDLGGSKYRILLDKAVELAEVLIGAFDTPNRMPQTFYLWKPTFASQPHRANTRVVLAEIGSLSVEFTRLAQITKEAKYYDAIARITNEFEMWQNNTRLPGLWPKKVDASGCKKSDAPILYPIEPPMQRGSKHRQNSYKDSDFAESSPETFSDGEAAKKAGMEKHQIKTGTGNGLLDEVEDDERPSSRISKTPLDKRQLLDDAPDQDSLMPKVDCKPQGLSSPPFASEEEFTLGGQADSIYEYLPKEYLLLGGLAPEYQSMYELSAEATKKYLIYRPMIPDEKRKILFAGQVATSGNLDDPDDVKLTAEGTHLTCFIGGMMGTAAKIFKREDDLEIAKQLTDACVWAYESTSTGIMPETFITLPCEDRAHCPWNETRYWEELDPFRATRGPKEKEHQAILDEKKAAIAQLAKDIAIDSSASAQKIKPQKTALASTTLSSEAAEASSTRKASFSKALSSEAVAAASKKNIPVEKRQLGDIENDESGTATSADTNQKSKYFKDVAKANAQKDATEEYLVTSSATSSEKVTPTIDPAKTEDVASNSASATSTPPIDATKPFIPSYTPPPIPTQEEYAKARIRDERLPPGMVSVRSSKYILRHVRPIILVGLVADSSISADLKLSNQSS